MTPPRGTSDHASSTACARVRWAARRAPSSPRSAPPPRAHRGQACGHEPGTFRRRCGRGPCGAARAATKPSHANRNGAATCAPACRMSTERSSAWGVARIVLPMEYPARPAPSPAGQPSSTASAAWSAATASETEKSVVRPRPLSAQGVAGRAPCRSPNESATSAPRPTVRPANAPPEEESASTPSTSGSVESADTCGRRASRGRSPMTPAASATATSGTPPRPADVRHASGPTSSSTAPTASSGPQTAPTARPTLGRSVRGAWRALSRPAVNISAAKPVAASSGRAPSSTSPGQKAPTASPAASSPRAADAPRRCAARPAVHTTSAATSTSSGRSKATGPAQKPAGSSAGRSCACACGTPVTVPATANASTRTAGAARIGRVMKRGRRSRVQLTTIPAGFRHWRR